MIRAHYSLSVNTFLKTRNISKKQNLCNAVFQDKIGIKPLMSETKFNLEEIVFSHITFDLCCLICHCDF